MPRIEEKGGQMGRVDKEEMAQWLQEMLSLTHEYARIHGRLTEGWKKGLTDYLEVWAQGELPALLTKLKEMPIPKEPECKHVKTNLEKAIDWQIKGRAAHAKQAKYKYEGASTSISERLSGGTVAGWLEASDNAFNSFDKGFVSLCKKYQMIVSQIPKD